MKRTKVNIKCGVCSKSFENFSGRVYCSVKCRKLGWNKYQSKIRKDFKIKVFRHYGLKCNCCNENIFEFLTIDHMNNDGAKHKREITKNKSNISQTNSITLYRWLIKNNFPKEFQTLCFNCNITKGVYGKCPHKT